MTKSDYGWCFVCHTHELKLVEHHCHLSDAVLDSARAVLEPKLGTDLAKNLPSAKHWSQDPRFPLVWRFEKTTICDNCNAIDGCCLGTRPGVYFSLSPNEMRAVRQKAGNRDNHGRAFTFALDVVRRRATPDYLTKLHKAKKLGEIMAWDWIAELAG